MLPILHCLLLTVFYGWGCVDSELPTKGQSLLYNLKEYQVVPLAVRKREGAKYSAYFTAFNEDFYLMLQPIEHSVYRNIVSKDLEIKTSGGSFKLHYLAYFYGHTYVTNHVAHGHFKSNGMLNGVIHFANNTDILFVEPASEYFDGGRYTRKAVVYKMSHITSPQLDVLTNLGRGSMDDMTTDKNAKPKVTKPSPYKPPKKKTGQHCSLSVVVDHLFYERKGESDYQRVMDEVLMYVIGMDKFFRGVDILGDGQPSNVGFQINEFRVVERHDSDYHFGDDVKNATDLLYAFSKLGFHSSCLGVLFTHRKLDGNLGSAWVPTEVNANRGICTKKAAFHGVLLSLNTLTISTYASQAQAFDALTHEFGHSFGAHHDDPDDSECSPGGVNGNYIMREDSEKSEFKPNHMKFSPCSLKAIQAFAKQHEKCFDKDLPVCGNGVLEDGEECDCGPKWICLKTEPWCVSSEGTENQKGCRILGKVGKKKCDPEKEPCCTLDGNIVPEVVKKICREEIECTSQGMCNGNSSACPTFVTYDGRFCENEAGVCHDGKCSHDHTFVHAKDGGKPNNVKYGTFNAIRGIKANRLALTISLSCVCVLILAIMLYVSCISGDGSNKAQIYRHDLDRHAKIFCYCCVLPDEQYEEVDQHEQSLEHQTQQKGNE